MSGQQPTPEAVEAVVEAMSARLHDTSDRWSPQQFRPAMSADTTSVQIGAEAALAFIRDALHRDGPDADAIRETLGLRLRSDMTCGQHYGQCFTGGHSNRLVLRRVVGDWREVQP